MRPGNYKRHKNHEFFDVGIGSFDGIYRGKSTLYCGGVKYKVKMLSTMMRDMGVDMVDMVRMDTEGAEWSVLSSWDYSRVGQLLLEIHMYDRLKDHASVLGNIPMKIFWSARNKWNNRKIYKDMTQVYELGFIQRAEKRAIFVFHHAHLHTGVDYMTFIHSILDQILMHTDVPVYFITNAAFKHFGVIVLPEVSIQWDALYVNDSGPWDTCFVRFLHIEHYMREFGIQQAVHVETDNIILKDIDFGYFEKKYGNELAMTPLGKHLFTGSVAWLGSLDSLVSMNKWMHNVWSPASLTRKKELVGSLDYTPTILESKSDMLALGAYSRANTLKMLQTVKNDVLFDPGTYGQLFVTKLKPSKITHHWVTDYAKKYTFDMLLPKLFNLHHYQPKKNIPSFVRNLETIDIGIPCIMKHSDLLRELIE